MEKYDYYAIKAAWNGANVSQRADDLEAAEKIADDLKGNGFIDVVIFGVKAGKREKLEGGKQAKPKAQERPSNATKPKAQAKAAPKVKTPVKDAKKQQDNDGQLDLFTPPPQNNKRFTLLFEHEELKSLNSALRAFKGDVSELFWYRDLIKCVHDAAYRGKTININLNLSEISAMISALEEWTKIYEDDDAIKLKNQLVKIAK